MREIEERLMGLNENEFRVKLGRILRSGREGLGDKINGGGKGITTGWRRLRKDDEEELRRKPLNWHPIMAARCCPAVYRV